MSRTTESGLLLLDKAVGETSRRAAGQAARRVGAKKYGHLGTLDPFATGLLPVMLGRATRLAQYFPQIPKAYSAEVKLGASTTTDDIEGEVLETAELPPLGADQLQRAAAAFLGRIRQRPSAFSAVRIDGQRAYKRARRGEVVEVPEREVDIHQLDLEVLAEDRLRLEVVCGSGTYIRSLARDLASWLGSRGHLVALRRTRVGDWTAADSAPVESMPDRGVIGMGPALALCGAVVNLPAAAQLHLRQGKPLAALEELHMLEPGRYSLFCASQPVALVEQDQNQGWRYCLVLPEPQNREHVVGG